MYDLIIIGAGASGMISAITAQRQGQRVLLIEKMSQAGRKLRITGKGRCNLTNTLPLKDFLKHCGSEPRFLYPSFNTFFSKDLVKFFEDLGVKTVEERGGRIFPESGKAQDVFLAMINELEDSDCRILKNTEVTSLIIEEGRVVGVKTKGNKDQIFKAPKIILAAGGESYPLTGSQGDGISLAKQVGHNIIPTIPSLVGLKLKYYNAERIHPCIIGFGVRNVNATLSLESGKKIAEEFGELTFREEGIEGPIILTLSRKVGRLLYNGEKVFLNIDFKPAIAEKELDAKLLRELDTRGKEDIRTLLRAFLPHELIYLLLDMTSFDPRKKSSFVSSQERKEILNFLKSCQFEIIGDFGYEQAIVTQGGVDLKEINPKTLESKLIPGLFFAGEVMDLDADTGGFNLQIAFSTGVLAAQDATKEEPQE
ncbi:MAG: NAD(P)/FAD-dependent oxidoreductase [Bacteroidales bacterium]